MARGAAQPAGSTTLQRLTARSFLEELTRPSSHVEAPEHRRRARLLASLLLFFTAAALVLTLLLPRFVAPANPDNGGLVPVGLGSATIGLALYVVSRSPQYEGAAWLSVGGILVSVSYATFSNHGTIWGDGAPYFLTLAVIFASVLLPLYASIVVSGAVLAILLTYYLYFPQYGALQLYSHLAFFALACSVLIFTSVARHFDLKQMEDTNRAIVLSEVRAREMLESTQAMVVHRDGRILEVTTRFARLFRASPKELVGYNLTGLVAEKDRGAAVTALSSPDETSWQAEGMRLDGRKFLLEAVTRPIEYMGESAHVTEVRPADDTAGIRAKAAAWWKAR